MDRHAGCMLGLAIGDALGAGMDGMRPGHVEQVYGEVDDFVDAIAAFPDRPARWRLRGVYTRHAQQALAVAEVLSVHGEADVRGLADLFVRLADEGPPGGEFGAWRGAGRVLRRAVSALADSDDARRCGQPSAGNGAAARAAVLGLFHAEDDEALGRSTIDCALITHSDPRAVAAALATARAVALCASGQLSPGARDAPQACRALAEWVEEWESRLGEEWSEFLDQASGRDRLHHVSRALRTLPSLVDEVSDDLAEKTVLRLANDGDPADKITQPQAGFACASVVMALYRAVSARSLPVAMIGAVSGGGEASAVGAIVGAVMGAGLGDEAIPEAWIDGLRNADGVRERARALRDGQIDWGARQDFVEMEKDLTRLELETFEQAAQANRGVIDKRQRRRAEHKARAAKAAAKRAPSDLPFAPPPEVWLRSDGSSAGDESRDPIEARKERARRGRRRIGWKQGRRGKDKKEPPSD